MSSFPCSSQPAAPNYSRPLPQIPPPHHLELAAHSPATSASEEEAGGFEDMLDLGRFLDMDDLRCGGDGITWRKPLTAPRAGFPFPQVIHFSRIPLPGTRRPSLSSSHRGSRTSVLLSNPRPQSYSRSAPSSPALDRTAIAERPYHPEPATEAPKSPLQSFFIGRRPSIALEQDVRYAWEMRERKQVDEVLEMEQRRWSSAMVLEPGEWETMGEQVLFEVMGVAL